MNLREHVHVTSTLHVHLSVSGEPALDRVIELPSGSPGSWLAEAYLLSIGIARESSGYDHDDPTRITAYGLGWGAHAGWGAHEESLTLPEVPFGVDLRVVSGRTPSIGDPLVAVLSEEAGDVPAATSNWRAEAPPFRREHVNDELVRRFGVVLPSFDRRGFRERFPGRIGMLFGALSPVRRLALRAHLDAAGLLNAPPSRDLALIDSATQSLRTLLAHVGRDGLTQDSETGWVSELDATAITDALGWSPAEAGVVESPAEVLLGFARRARILRRLKGRVVATNCGWGIVEPRRDTLLELARQVTDTGGGYSHGYGTGNIEMALALLAVADGSARSLAEISEHVALEDGIVDSSFAYAAGCDDDELDFWHDRARESTSGELGARTRAMIDALAAFSEPGRFGEITPAMRAVAGTALT